MSNSYRRGGGVIAFTLILSLALAIMPMPDWAAHARPQWAALILIYWCMALPERVGVGIGWCTGLVQDALTGTLLGQHALAYTLLAYLTIKLHQRIRVFPIWQQALSVLVLLLLTQLVMYWIRGVIGRPPAEWSYWLTAVTGTLLWPWVFVLMREVRRNFGVR